MAYRRPNRVRAAAMPGAAPRVQITRHLGGWEEFLALSALSDGTRGSSHEHESGRGWRDTATFEDAVKLARNGWPQGAERLADLTARLEGRLQNRAAVKLPGYSVVGPGVLDMGRYLMGHPEPYMVWVDSDETQDINPDRVLRILCNGTANGGAGSEVIWNRGAAAAVIADLAESQGVRVEIELVFANQSWNGSHSKFYVPLKRAQDHVPAELLAFALAHPSSLRRLMFGVWETLSPAERTALDIGRGYGNALDVDPDGAIYMPAISFGGDANFHSAESTAAWIVRTLKTHGIEVEKQ